VCALGEIDILASLRVRSLSSPRKCGSSPFAPRKSRRDLTRTHGENGKDDSVHTSESSLAATRLHTFAGDEGAAGGGVKREVGKKGKRHRCAKLMDEGIPPRLPSEQSEERDPLLRGCRRKSKRSGKTDRVVSPGNRSHGKTVSGHRSASRTRHPARSQRGCTPYCPPRFTAPISAKTPNRSALSLSPPSRKKRGACIPRCDRGNDPHPIRSDREYEETTR